MDPAAAPFHQADRVLGAPVETAPGAGVLKPLHLTGRMTISVRRLAQGLVVAMMTTTKGDITNKGFYISKDRKMDSI